MKRLQRTSCNSLDRRRGHAIRIARAGVAQFEVVMTAAVALPLAMAILFTGVKACQYFYQIVSALVSWPYL